MDKTENFGYLSNLEVEKLELLTRAIAPILTSPVAQDTFAQMVDGQPNWPSYKKKYSMI